jgi:hypothetical protein
MSLFRRIRRWFDRRRARSLLKSGLARGLASTEVQVRPALRVARDAPAGTFATLSTGAQIVRGEPPRALLRLSALPPPLPDLGVARPDRFRLDEDLRLPPERDAARTAANAPPVDHGWVHPALRREKLETPWMARDRLYGLAPLPVEWFVLWWDQSRRGAARVANPTPWPVPEDLAWKMDEVKEQMLIRRDVVRDERPPKDGAFVLSQSGPSINKHEPPAVGELIPDTEWVETFEMPRAAPDGMAGDSRPMSEASLEWRTLVRMLDDG